MLLSEQGAGEGLAELLAEESLAPPAALWQQAAHVVSWKRRGAGLLGRKDIC